MSNNNTPNFSNPQNNHRPQLGHPGNYQNQNLEKLCIMLKFEKTSFRKTHPSKIRNRRRVRFCRMNLKQEKSKIMQNEFEMGEN
jgi:hypothetical protein